MTTTKATEMTTKKNDNYFVTFPFLRLHCEHIALHRIASIHRVSSISPLPSIAKKTRKPAQ